MFIFLRLSFGPTPCSGYSYLVMLLITRLNVECALAIVLLCSFSCPANIMSTLILGCSAASFIEMLYVVLFLGVES